MTAKRQVWNVGDPMPLVLTDRQLMDILQYGSSRFYQLKAAGEFRVLEVPPLRHQPAMTTTRYSGRKVLEYAEDASRFLSSHRRHQQHQKSTRGRRPRQAAEPLPQAPESRAPSGSDTPLELPELVLRGGR